MKKMLIRLFSVVMVIAIILSFSIIPSYAADKEYISSLKNAGFPSDYAELLEKVHAKHPKWTFTPLVTGLNFDDAVAGESKAGLTTTDVTVSYFLLISRDKGSYNSDGTYTYKIVDGNQSKQTGHADASDLCISYFMDPRNFLTEDRTIFQFLDMSYPDDDAGLRDSVVTAVSGTFLKKHVDALMTAGTTYDINPVYLVSKIFQEVGTSGENSAVNGKVSGYEGYYNCYNIGAYASSTGTAVINGLKYAKDKGWTSIDKSIIGGAEFIAKGYTSVGQHTPYLTKFNVNPKNTSYSLYTHQYMSAVNDPAQSARTIYNAYNEANILDTTINFVIPVFKDMPTFSSTSVKLDDSTNSVVGKEPSSNNFYLRTEPNRNASYYSENGKAKAFANGTSVTILDRVRSNIVTDDDSSHNLYMFQLKLPFWYKVKVGKIEAYTAYENIPIDATVTMKVGDKRTFGYSLTNGVTGAVRFEVLDSRIATVNAKTGEVVAKSTGTTQLIAYTASGSVDYINLTVALAEGVPEKITSSKLEINQSKKLVSNISAGTTVNKLLSSVNETDYVAVYKDGEKQAKDVKLATGMQLCLVVNGNIIKQYTIAVTGDTNCDGSLGPGDAVLVLRHLSNLQSLSDAALLAADANKDGDYGPGDAVTILRAIN
ncbi:MAG: hypothetical protein KBS43_04040 [Oscillospiraceae bacterium]|nr:hypothetical protein [Candidatus Limimonas coprohippi]